MVNIKFPETDIVSCVFSLKNGSPTQMTVGMNSMGIIEEDSALRKLKEYKYRVPEYLQGQLHEGDFVVVFCTTGYQVCQVTRINEFAAVESSKLAPVVAKVSLDDYFNDLLHQEQLKKMKEALLKERKRLEEQVTWDLIASKNPDFADMLKAFRDAGGQL